MVKKKIVMLALTAVLLLTTYSVPVSAAENAAVIGTVASAQTIAPLWESTKTVVPSISISGKQISVSVYISPISSTTTTTGKLYLEKKSGNGWAPVKSGPLNVMGKVTTPRTNSAKTGLTTGTKLVVQTGAAEFAVVFTEPPAKIF